MKRIIIGTRGSQLSLVQTEIIKELIQKLDPKIGIKTKIITTTGDKNMQPVPLDSVGKGWFTKEIDRALLSGKIDIAVHSLKDLPEKLPEGLVIAAIPAREDAREALVSKKGVTLQKLARGAIIGTDSTRRKSQILFMRNDLRVESLRGNVNRRLEKLEKENYDAIILAVAGLNRLGLQKKITQYFAVTDFIPSPGQGALAVVVKKSNTNLIKVLKNLNDNSTVASVKAERSFSKTIGGGCKLPVGAYAKIQNKKLTVYGVVGSLDGKFISKDSISGEEKNAAALGRQLGKLLLQKSSPWYKKV